MYNIQCLPWGRTVLSVSASPFSVITEVKRAHSVQISEASTTQSLLVLCTIDLLFDYLTPCRVCSFRRSKSKVL